MESGSKYYCERTAARLPEDLETRLAPASALEAPGDQLLRGTGESAAALEVFRGSPRQSEQLV